MHERFMFGALSRLVRPGDVVYDVGANLGLYSRFFAQVFGASKVLAFEPMSGNRADLQRNLLLGGVNDRVQIFPCALAETEGEELLQLDEVASGAAVLDRVSGGQASESHRQYGVEPRTERVRVRTLDALARAESLHPPGVIKIDVEGAEALVLRGGRETIARYRPRLAIELHGPDTAREVLPILHEHGYAVAAHGYRRGEYWFASVGPDAAREAVEPYEFHFVFAAESSAVFDPPFARWNADGKDRGAP